jgi:hypothetical protein
MKVLKNWLTSLACIAISVVSLGQTQNLKVYNYTSEPLYVQAWAVDDCNGTEQVSGTYYLAAFTGVANIPVIYNTGTYPNAEWLIVRASEGGASFYGQDNDSGFACSSITNYPFFTGTLGPIGSPTPIVTSIVWSSAFVAEIN